MEQGTYTFDQLSDKLKEEAIEASREINVFGDWHDPLIEGFQEDLTGMGVENVEVQYSGFWSQGDGASFTGSVGDIYTFVVKTLGLDEFDYESKNLPKSGARNVKNFLDSLTIDFVRDSHRYSHENTCSASIESYIDFWDSEEFPNGNIMLTGVITGGDESAFVLMSADDALHRIEEAAEEWRLDQCRELYSSLEKEYDYLQSDEAVGETLESIGTEFEVDEDGELVI